MHEYSYKSLFLVNHSPANVRWKFHRLGKLTRQREKKIVAGEVV